MKNIIVYGFIFVFLMLLSPGVIAQENIQYQKPSEDLLKLVDYDRVPIVRFDSNREVMLYLYRDQFKSLSDLSMPQMRLAGLRINPVTNIASDVTYYTNAKIKRVDKINDQPKDIIGMPENLQMANISFSPNDKFIAFTNTTINGVELWVIDIDNFKAYKLTDNTVNANLNNPFTWMKDSESLLVRLLPADRGSIISQEAVLPAGPIISQSKGIKSQNRTFQDLLKNSVDEQNFELLATSQLYVVDLNGAKELFLDSAIYTSEIISPDGSMVLISTIERPYSYIVPMNRFPRRSTVYSFDGTFKKVVNETPLMEISPKGFSSARDGMRSLGWRADKPSSLYYIEALDGGDPSINVEYRDQLVQWDYPFDSTPRTLVKIEGRYEGVIWGDDNYAIISDSWYNTRNTKSYLFSPSDFTVKPIVLVNRNSQDIYSDPGSFQLQRNEYGRGVLRINKGNIYLIGDGFSENGHNPFLDELNLKTLNKKRLYSSNLDGKREDIESIMQIGSGSTKLLVRLQSQTEYPNFYIRDLGRGQRSKLTAITNFSNPVEEISKLYKEVITYKREDGVILSGTLYLPSDYDFINKPKLPMLLWAYPREYADIESASQNNTNPNTFTLPSTSSFVYWATKGYAVLQGAAFPIVGIDGNEPNDTFIEQLIMNAKAAIDALDGLGYIDRERVAVGGHSYGAFMTANLLTHSSLFKCGVARSGAYNRTLTPFGFQREQRNFWDVPEVYNRMSPFMHAHKMKKPILLVHGEADNNAGTFTFQTERYFQALKGLGADARMVILPLESHGYEAKESILHLLWEQDRFFEENLKK